MRSLLRRYREPLFVALLLALPFTVFAVKAKQKVALNAADRVVIAVTAPVEKLIVAAVHVGQDAWHDYVALGSVREENFRLPMCPPTEPTREALRGALGELGLLPRA